MVDCDNDNNICYDDFITFLACSGSQYAKTTKLGFNIGEKDKNRHLETWEEIDVAPQAIFCQILEDSLKLAKKILVLQEDFPIEISQLRQKIAQYVDKEEGSRRRMLNRFDESGWAKTRISLYEYDAIRNAFWEKGVRIGTCGGVDEYTLRLVLR
jgi:hypothetical protein